MKHLMKMEIYYLKNMIKELTVFLDEFDWYLEDFKNQRVKGTPY